MFQHLGKAAAKFFGVRMQGSPSNYVIPQQKSTGVGIPIHRDVFAGSIKEEPRRFIGKLVELVEKDYQFSLGKRVLSSVVSSAKAVVEVESEDPRAKALADDLTKQWERIKSHAMDAIGYGRVAFEKTYRYDPATNLHCVKSLDHLPFDKTEMVLEDGSFAGVKLSNAKGNHVTIEKDSSWWFALDSDVQQPHGRSRYMGAVQEVFEDRFRLGENEDMWLDRFALGIWTVRAPDRYSVDAIASRGDRGDIGTNGLPQNPIADTVNSLLAAKSGGVVGISSSTDDKGRPEFDISAQPISADSGPLEARRRLLDVAALRALGIPELAVMQGDTGAYAMSQTHMEVLYNNADGILGQLAESFQRCVIDPCVSLNFTGGVKLWLTVEKLTDRAKKASLYTEIVRTALQSPQVSPLLAVIDFAQLVEFVGLPLVDEAKAKLDAIMASQLEIVKAQKDLVAAQVLQMKAATAQALMPPPQPQGPANTPPAQPQAMQPRLVERRFSIEPEPDWDKRASDLVREIKAELDAAQVHMADSDPATLAAELDDEDSPARRLLQPGSRDALATDDAGHAPHGPGGTTGDRSEG